MKRIRSINCATGHIVSTTHNLFFIIATNDQNNERVEMAILKTYFSLKILCLGKHNS